jgi:hypothetical protein
MRAPSLKKDYTTQQTAPPDFADRKLHAIYMRV